ncbi:MAG: hypothetical protein A2Y24_01055 [Clostridiales bacterium GWE2_32_10]|nr:MAG: hypothetical protein A2Y24_01055 [Clostridiales bacterium GWE2_32_10]HBY21202.1 hypothetical protein [Clostridiales bacterium]
MYKFLINLILKSKLATVITLIIGILFVGFIIVMVVITSNDIKINIINTNSNNIKVLVINKATNKEISKNINKLSSNTISIDEGIFDIKINDLNNNQIRNFNNINLTKSSNNEFFIDTTDTNMYYFVEFSDIYENNNVNKDDLYFNVFNSSDIIAVNNKSSFTFYTQYDKLPNSLSTDGRVIMLCPISKEETKKMTEEQLNNYINNFVQNSFETRIFDAFKK